MIQNQSGRQGKMAQIRDVRDGKIQRLQNEVFSDEWPESTVSNLIQTMAEDTRRSIAPLPALNCASGAMRTGADKKRASLKNKIGHQYWEQSRLAIQMANHGADYYSSYGYVAISVEPCFEEKTPRIVVEQTLGSYFENDRHGRTQRWARRWYEDALSLASKFPHLAGQILHDTDGRPFTGDHEVVKYVDAKGSTMYLRTGRKPVLVEHESFVKGCAVQVARRPNLNEWETQGQWDQCVYIQLARTVLGRYTLDAAEKSVTAPIQMPRDAHEMALGPDAIIRTDGNVRRVPLDVPSAVFAEEAKLQEEQLRAGGAAQASQAAVTANIITGRGIDALNVGFDSAIKEAQTIIGETLSIVTGMCFEMDERLWPHRESLIQGTMSGETYEAKYTPGKDINGNYECDVTYGFAAGQSPNQAVIMLLQLMQAKIIDHATVRRNLPFDLDPEMVQRAIDVEQIDEAIMQGLMSMAQSSGLMIQQGQNPIEMFKALALITKGRKDGKDLADLLEQAFTPPEPGPGQEQAGSPEQQLLAALTGGGAPGGAPGGGAPTDGLLPGQAPGQQGMMPGGRPSVMDMVSGMRNGQPVSDITTKSRTAV